MRRNGGIKKGGQLAPDLLLTLHGVVIPFAYLPGGDRLLRYISIPSSDFASPS